MLRRLKRISDFELIFMMQTLRFMASSLRCTLVQFYAAFFLSSIVSPKRTMRYSLFVSDIAGVVPSTLR